MKLIFSTKINYRMTVVQELNVKSTEVVPNIQDKVVLDGIEYIVRYRTITYTKATMGEDYVKEINFHIYKEVDSEGY